MRALRARPAFATLIVCCLAIGIGANIAMFSIANVLFLRPPTGVRNADALMRLYVVRRSGETQSPQGGAFSYPDFADLRHAPDAFAGVAASHPASFTVGHGADAETVIGEFASADYFRVLGTRTARGRFFTADEDSVRGLHPAVVLGYGYWQSRFQGRDVVGHTMTIDDRLFTIVGIAERGFQGAGYSQRSLVAERPDRAGLAHGSPAKPVHAVALRDCPASTRHIGGSSADAGHGSADGRRRGGSQGRSASASHLQSVVQRH
ncbi:MAG TPA: ABC transporter permease [Gemmatimonadaceae bacterium]|nr:ABC transporter permease [Gemmatimonadaceae bacterium]